VIRKIPLLFFFALALIPAILGSILFPLFPLSAFAPFLAIVFYVAPFPKALWIAFGCGLILDLLSSEFHFGVHALTLVCASLLLFHQKKYFFEDKPLAVFLFTATISSVSTILQLLFVHIFDRGISFSFAAFVTDIIFLPLADGLYGFLWFTCLARLYIYVKRKVLFKYGQSV
jgi:rod shape-determining protein MreD